MPPRSQGAKRQTTVRSVARGLDLLEALGQRGELGLVELAKATDLEPSTAHRLVATLAEREYVVRDLASGRYRLSQKVLELVGRAEHRSSNIRAAARPHLEEIAAQSDETTNLVLLEGTSAVYVDQVESSRAVRMFTEIGRRVPAYATGAGKAMLAFQPADLIAGLAAFEPFERLTPHTVTGLAALERDLATARSRGYALDNGEYEELVMCVGAPVLTPAGVADAAISVSGPATRIQRVDVDALGGLLARHALAVAREMGYAGPGGDVV